VIGPLARRRCPTRGRTVARALVSVWVALVPAALAAQPQPQPQPAGSIATALRAERAAQPVTLSFYNRPIVVFRARVVGREPADRAIGAHRLLDELVAQRTIGPVVSRSFDDGSLISVASRGILLLVTADADELAGETLESVTTQTVANLTRALGEAAEAHTPGMLLREVAAATAAVVVAVLVLWMLGRARRRMGVALLNVAERRMAHVDNAALDALRVSRVLDAQRYVVTGVMTAIDLVVVYGTTTFVLRQFPYTRVWGESMSGFLVGSLQSLGLSAMRALPGLFTVCLIFVMTRFIVRVASAWFNAVEQGRAHARWIHPETAQPTRRLTTALLWIFAVVVAYPYMPGSQSDAFKGVSVFLGLMVTFGSSGLVNHVMSGFMITYSRSLRVGDFVRIGDVEGTVTHVGVLSTKIQSILREEITIPNAVVVAQTTKDYSRLGDAGAVYTPTSVTIGYDAPWRQVHALLLLAAARTPGLRAEPRPLVLQTSLEDFYVKYMLVVCLVRQDTRAIVLDALHANIQDLFNEYGVQIMSPNYVLDPATPKVVPKGQWFASPAQAESPAPPANDAGAVHSAGS
jgi:small-conductance mechanosensitive channel